VREQIFRPRLTWRRKAEVPEMISVKVEIPIDMKAIGLHCLNVQGRTDSGARALKSRWWSHLSTIRHINRMVCGKAVDGFSEGFNFQRPARNK
jgi:hypothetical protein